MSRYVPPAKRVNIEIVSLSPDNFPEISNGSSASPVKSPMNFKDCFKVPEKPDESHKTYPGGINPETRAKMIADGWSFLSITATRERGFCEKWNAKMASYANGLFGATTIPADVHSIPNNNVDYGNDSDSDDSYTSYKYSEDHSSDDD